MKLELVTRSKSFLNGGIMKKILILVMSLVLLGGMVFGAGPVPDTSKSFKITTTIPAMAELKIHKTEGIDTISEFNSTGLEQKTEQAFGDLTDGTDTPTTVNSGDYYLSVKTNAKTATYIKATFNVMTATTGSGNTLDYTLNYGTSSTKASVNNGAALSIFTIPAANGARVVSNSFSIDILGADIQSAVPDSYSATITFQYTAT